MTPIILLERLQEFVKEKTADIILQVRTAPGKRIKARAPEVYRMRLPKKEDEVQQIPYILLQFIKGEDGKNDRGEKISTCMVRIVVATYSEKEEDGAYDVLNILTRLRAEFQKVGVIGNQFVLRDPLEYIVYPDETAPYYLGEMMTTWEIPNIKREVEKIWQ